MTISLTDLFTARDEINNSGLNLSAQVWSKAFIGGTYSFAGAQSDINSLLEMASRYLTETQFAVFKAIQFDASVDIDPQDETAIKIVFRDSAVRLIFSLDIYYEGDSTELTLEEFFHRFDKLNSCLNKYRLKLVAVLPQFMALDGAGYYCSSWNDVRKYATALSDNDNMTFCTRPLTMTSAVHDNQNELTCKEIKSFNRLDFYLMET